MLDTFSGVPDWFRLAACGGLALAGALGLPVVMGVFFRRAHRPPGLRAWVLCIGGCVVCVLAAFAADFMIARIDEHRGRAFAERIGLVRTSQGSSSDEYESPSGWSMAAPASPGGVGGGSGGRATYMRMSVRKAGFAEAQAVVVAAMSAAVVSGLLFYGMTRGLARAASA